MQFFWIFNRPWHILQNSGASFFLQRLSVHKLTPRPILAEHIRMEGFTLLSFIILRDVHFVLQLLIAMRKWAGRLKFAEARNLKVPAQFRLILDLKPWNIGRVVLSIVERFFWFWHERFPARRGAGSAEELSLLRLGVVVGRYYCRIGRNQWTAVLCLKLVRILFCRLICLRLHLRRVERIFLPQRKRHKLCCVNW